MNLKFLVALLNWLQEQLLKTHEKHLAAAAAYTEKIKVLAVERLDHQESASLAKRLAEKIEALLSE